MTGRTPYLRSALAALALVAALHLTAPAATAATIAGATASSSARGAAPGLAADGRAGTAWRPARAGAWAWRGRLAQAASLDRVRVLAARSVDDARIAVSEDGRRYVHVRTVDLRRGAWRAVAAGGRRARFIRISGRTRRRPAGGLAEVTVRVRPVGPAVASAAAASQPVPDQGPPAPGPGANPGPDAGPGPDPEPACEPRAPTAPPPTPAAELPAAVAPGAAGAPPPTPAAGRTFDGVVADPISAHHLEDLPFLTRSHWLQPWRAYLDTPPASRLRNAIGMNFNAERKDAYPVARLLAANGFRRARIEIPWGDFAYESPRGTVPRLQAFHGERFARMLCAVRDAGMRPLILLNASDQQPVPSYRVELTVAADVAKGATEIPLEPDSAGEVITPYTGFDGAFAAESLVLEMRDGNVAKVSKPLRVAKQFEDEVIPKGTVLRATVLKYLPFSPPEHDDGAANPYSEETLTGWLRYVEAVTDFVSSYLGSTGFDLEISNELNLNAAFWDVNNSFEPRLFREGLADQVIVDRTVEQVRDLPGLRVTNGFASQRPWDSGATSPPGLDALSKHFYPRNLRFPDVLTCDTRPVDPCPRADPLRTNEPVDATSARTGTKDDTGRWVEPFTPTYDAFFPEYWLAGISTETLVRDLAPWTETFGNPGAAHGRAATPELWMTEMGLETGWAQAAGGLGLTLTDDDVAHLRAKAALRTLVSYVHKGVRHVDFYAAVTREWGLVGGDFWDRWKNTGRYPGDDTGGPVMAGVRRLVDALGDAEVTTPRSLTLASIGDYGGRTQFAGDGSAAHPTLFDRDVLAFLPFQASGGRFVIPVYVMTRNMAKERPGATGPARFDLPAERYQLTIGGTDAQRVRASAVDPLTGDAVPVDVVRRTDDGWLVVELPVTDSPRLLILDDAGA